MKNGDKVSIKGTGAEGIVKGFGVRGCQLHGDPIEYVIIKVTKPGHYIKKKMNLHVNRSELEYLK